jgi:hypothetical protein
MLLIILAIFWLALLAPVAIRRLRDGGAERSIQSFHAEHEVLSRQEYAVPPAHRLDQSDEAETSVNDTLRRPRLTVVHADDTYRSLESRSSWDEWANDYDYDDEPSNDRQMNRYAQAYASVPNEINVTNVNEPPIRRRSMHSRRRMMFTRLVAFALVISIIAFVANYTLVMDLAILSWVCVLSFVAMALFAVSQGFLDESSLPLSFLQPRPLATVQPLYYDDYRVEHQPDDYYDDEDDDDRWERASQPRTAFG